MFLRAAADIVRCVERVFMEMRKLNNLSSSLLTSSLANNAQAKKIKFNLKSVCFIPNYFNQVNGRARAAMFFSGRTNTSLLWAFMLYIWMSICVVSENQEQHFFFLRRPNGIFNQRSITNISPISDNSFPLITIQLKLNQRQVKTFKFFFSTEQHF